MNQDPTPLEPLPLDDPLAIALRRALTSEADAVTPSADGLVRIRQSIDAGTGTARRRTAIAALAAAAVVAVAGGSALLARPGQDRPPVSAPPAGSPSPRPSGSPSGSGSAAGSAGLPVYYVGTVGASFGLFRELHARVGGGPPSSDPARRVQQAVTEAMAGRPLDPDYRTLWAEGADARTTLSADRITIELNEAAAGGTAVGGSDADVYALQQLIWTATAASTDPNAPTEVVIRALGPTPERFGSISLSQPFRRGTRPGAGDPRAPVWIESLGQGATVGPGPLTVSGQGVGGARPLRWTLTQDGIPVASGDVEPTTGTGAPAGAGVRGSWTITLTPPGAGRYTLAVAEDLPSDATGGVDDKDFVVG